MNFRHPRIVRLSLILLSGLAAMALSSHAYPENTRGVDDEREEEAVTLANRIFAGYAKINTLSCHVRKTTTIKGRRINMLSRVYYQHPDRLHVENILPARRRILSDGVRFYMAQEEWKKSYSVPLDELSGELRIMQKSVPGTAMEHLMRLKDAEEIVLDAAPDLPTRRGYRTDHVFVVLSCDDKGRPAQIEFFKDKEMAERVAIYKYGNFVHVAGDCWLPTHHHAEVILDGETLKEARRFDNLQINQPIADGMFDPDVFFKDKLFVSDFSELE